MKEESPAPRTLMEAIIYFGKPGVARDFIAQLRWPKGPFCEKCGQTDPMFLASVERWKCRGCGTQFSVKRGTIMEDSPISLDKWLCAMWMIANCKNGVSSYEIHRALGVTQKSAWFMLHRIRLAMKNKSIKKMAGPVEVDESFIGGKVGNMSNKKRREFGNKGNPRKAVVMGILERGGEILVAAGARVFTDSLPTYVTLRDNFLHESVNHFRDEWVRGDAHTNGIENFWSLFKRSLGGTYVNVEPFHLFRYLDEQVFRFNNRKDTDAGRFGKLLSMLAGKRLTFKALTTGMEAQTC